jgi:hypothetical protein
MRPIDVIISSYNRPLHLWASLDSLCRCTQYPHRFVLLDMASDDPLIPRVIAGFERRGMFSQVIRSPRNHPQEFWKAVWSLVAGGGEFIGHVDGDVVVEDSEPCWLGAFVALMERNRGLAMVGPRIDKRDFISWENAREIAPDIDEERLADLIKLKSPERHQDVSQGGARDLVYPHNPPGRLLLMRSWALALVGAGTDGALDRKLRDAGYETGIATGVRHRHLSLLNLFDYPDYDVANRDAFMSSTDAGWN